MKAKNLLKAITLVSTAGLMMGNQSCQQQAASRSYRKIVEMGSIQAQPIQLPDGSTFDFKYVANQQLYGVISQSTQFTLRTSAPIAGDPSLASSSSLAQSSAFNLSKADLSMLQKSFDAKQMDFRAAFSRTAWCMVNLPQARIYGSINSFEIVGGGGIKLGYTPAGSIFAGIAGANANISVQFAQMDLSMRAMPALGTTVLGAVDINSTQTKTNVGLNIDFGLFEVGPSAYYSTPLATVTKNGLIKGLSGVAADMDSKPSNDWYSRVFADQDTSLVLVGGADVGYEVGDQLDIYNEQYSWSGEACNSTYQGSTGIGADSYYGRVEITSVGDQLAQAKVIQIDPNASQGFASVGAKVIAYKTHEVLASEAAAAAKK